MSFLKKNSKEIAIFVSLILLVFISQYLTLKPVLGMGLVYDDFVDLMSAVAWRGKSYVEIWKMVGPHNAYQIFFVGIVHSLFGLNFENYIKFNIFLKILATLSLYPLILVISKSKLMAFLGTLIFALSPASAGGLNYYVTGVEYLGLLFMNLFLTTYYYSVKCLNPISSALSGLFILLTLLASPIRTFPVFGIICLVELIMLLRFKGIFSYKYLFRLACFLPVIILLYINFHYIFSGDIYSLNKQGGFQTQIANGNWYVLLNSISGVGYSILPHIYFNFFGAIDLSNLQNYLIFLLSGSFIVYGFIVLLLSLFLSRKPILFFIFTMFSATVLSIITFVLGTHHFGISKELIRDYDFYIFYFSQGEAIVTNLVVALSLSSGFEWWLINRKNKFLLFIFLSPLFALFFSISQWLFTQSDYVEISRYSVIPQMGISFFFASLLTFIYNKTPKKLRSFPYLVIGVFFLCIFNIGKNEVFRHFDYQQKAGQSLSMQNWQQDQILSQINDKNPNADLFIYVKFPEDTIPVSNPWAAALDIPNFVRWMTLKRGLLTSGNGDGCIIVTWNKAALEESAIVRDNIKGFIYKNDQSKQGGCYEKRLGIEVKDKFIKLNNFYAFSTEGSKIDNITQAVINNLTWRIN